MKEKQVIYNGGKDSYYGCSNPNVLVVGKVYTVLKEHNRFWQTDFTLEGVEGKFDSRWFYEAPRTYIAIGTTTPVVGKHYVCSRIVRNENDDSYCMEDCTTSCVQEVECVGSGGYKVTTKNSIYLVTVQ